MSRIASVPVEPKSEKDWRAKGDARTLTEAAEIMNDPKRFKAAKKWVSIQVIEAQDKLKTALKVESDLSKKG